MGAFDMVLNEVESKFGLGGGKATSLLSGLLAFINQSGGPSGLLDRFKNSGSGDWVSSVLNGNAKAISADHVENALGQTAIGTIASKAVISAGAASSALAFMLPKLMQGLAPGGAVPSHLPSEFMSYLSGPTAAVATGARQAVYAAERATGGISRFLWPILGLLALAL